MKIEAQASVQKITGGVAVLLDQPPLAGHGLDSRDAANSLERVVRAWCQALIRRGELETTLDRHGIRWKSSGATLEIEVRLNNQ